MVGTIASVGDRRLARKASALFLLSAVGSATAVGAGAGWLGEAIGIAEVSPSAKAVTVLLVVALAVSSDGGRLRLRWPYLRRQVRAGVWNRSGPSVAALIWGSELGVGLLTHVPEKLVYALLVLCLLSGTLGGALLYGMYGAIKGLQPFAAAIASEKQVRVPAFALRVARSARVMTVCASAFAAALSAATLR